MVEKIDRETSVSQAGYGLKLASKLPESFYKKGVLHFKSNRAIGKGWRLVHNGVSVIALSEGSDKDMTETIHEIEEFTTEAAGLEQIKTLGLHH